MSQILLLDVSIEHSSAYLVPVEMWARLDNGWGFSRGMLRNCRATSHVRILSKRMPSLPRFLDRNSQLGSVPQRSLSRSVELAICSTWRASISCGIELAKENVFWPHKETIEKACIWKVVCVEVRGSGGCVKEDDHVTRMSRVGSWGGHGSVNSRKAGKRRSWRCLIRQACNGSHN